MCLQETVWMDVQQTIYDGYTNHKEQFVYRGFAQLIKLASYWRLKYQDKDGATIILKWNPSEVAKSTPYVEIRQNQYDLLFIKDKTTITHYPTPQGNWPLEVTTHHLLFREIDEASYQIEVDYQIQLNQETLGHYEYRLQFRPEIVNM